jgi:hypothetical protein
MSQLGFCNHCLVVSLGSATTVSWSSEEFIDGLNNPVFGHVVTSDTLTLE